MRRTLPREAWAKRVVVGAIVALVVVGIAVIPALLAGGTTPSTQELNNSEYNVERIAVTAVPAEGDIEADGNANGKTILIDAAHTNRYNREDIVPLVEAFLDIGFNVEFHDGGDLGEALSDADAYLVIDPGSGFDPGEVDAVKNFTQAGGRVAVLGEPNRKTVTVTGFSASITTQRSEVTELAAAYDLSFRTSYVYNQQRNGGNYKHVLASPTGPAAEAGDRITLFTATRVVSPNGGQVVLKSAPGTRSSAGDGTGQYALAVRKGNLLAVGDSTFIRPGRYNVGDNEAFVGYLVEFLAEGDRSGPVEAGNTTDA